MTCGGCEVPGARGLGRGAARKEALAPPPALHTLHALSASTVPAACSGASGPRAAPRPPAHTTNRSRRGGQHPPSRSAAPAHGWAPAPEPGTQPASSPGSKVGPGGEGMGQVADRAWKTGGAREGGWGAGAGPRAAARGSRGLWRRVSCVAATRSGVRRAASNSPAHVRCCCRFALPAAGSCCARCNLDGASCCAAAVAATKRQQPPVSALHCQQRHPPNAAWLGCVASILSAAANPSYKAPVLLASQPINVVTSLQAVLLPRALCRNGAAELAALRHAIPPREPAPLPPLCRLVNGSAARLAPVQLANHTCAANCRCRLRRRC